VSWMGWTGVGCEWRELGEGAGSAGREGGRCLREMSVVVLWSIFLRRMHDLVCPGHGARVCEARLIELALRKLEIVHGMIQNCELYNSVKQHILEH
jgi:hypothetical protein